MRATSVDLIGGYYTDDSLPWACQDTVNWLPVMAEVAGTLTPKRLATPPGLRPYQAIGAGPIRGVHDCEGLRLVVSGSGLYRITNDGVGVLIGQIPGVGRVSMTHNQFKTGNQVLVENGQVGGGYVYNTVDQTFGRITDEGYPGSISSDYLDSFLLGVEPLGRYWFHSNLADATDYNTLDRYEAEASPDRIVGLATSRDEVVVFGQRTTEFFFNAGQATGTFQNRRTTMDRGCAGRHTIQKLDNTLFWLGDDGVVYRLNGYAPEPVSTRVLDRAISGNNWAEAFAFVWEDRGFKVYYLTFPDGMTFGYDVVTRVWHRRESFGLNRWRLMDTIRWGRKWYGGDFQTGRVWELDWDYFLEGNQPIISERTSPVLSDSQSRVGLNKVELQFDTGQGPETQRDLPRLSGSIANGLVGQALAGKYTATRGAAPYGPIEVAAGQFPPGLTLAANGAVSGYPTTAGTYAWTLRVRDADGNYATLEDDNMIVNPALVATIPVVSRLLLGSTGGGASGASSMTIKNQPWNTGISARPGDWAIFHMRSWSSGSDVIPPEARTLIYTADSQGGSVFYDSEWRGDVSHQAAMSASLLANPARAPYNGPIRSTPITPLPSGTTYNFFTQSDPFVFPAQLATSFSGRWLTFRVGPTFSCNFFVQYPDPAQIPVGAVKIMDLPGYYITPSGVVYRVNWNRTAVANS